MNRRDSLKALGLLAAGTGVLANSCKSGGEDKAGKAAVDSSDKLPGVQDFEHARTQKLMEEKFFNEHEFATLAVLVDYIIPKDDVSGSATDAGVPDFIEFIIKDIPSYKIPMRGGLKWLDIRAQKKFKNVFLKCDGKQQIALIDEIAFPSKAKPEVQQGVSFFKTLRDLTASGFYTSKIGIEDIGYVGNRPGVWTGVPEDVLKEHGFATDEG